MQDPLREEREASEPANQGAEAELYQELRAVAVGLLRKTSPHHSLQPTEVVHEAWLRVADRPHLDFGDRRSYLAFAAKVMRSLLLDRARARGALKRGGTGRRVSLHSQLLDPQSSGPLDVLEVDQAIHKLAAQDEESGRIVELRFFGGMEMQDIADTIGCSISHVERRWRFAKAWLRVELDKAESSSES